jgi:hypothetical protein
MPFALLIAGIVLTVSGVRGTTGELTQLVKGDFQGDKNFAYWMVSILAIGAIGYIEDFRPLSRMFLVLVVVVLFLSNRGVFASFSQQAFTSTTGTGTTDSYAGLTPQ